MPRRFKHMRMLEVGKPTNVTGFTICTSHLSSPSPLTRRLTTNSDRSRLRKSKALNKKTVERAKI